jgi:hypothetical protein
MHKPKDHIFISYASEDFQIAKWLTCKLTSEGYKVWCDHIKLLGGESYPKDIDDAIRNRTFRLLGLISKYSINKDNPIKERTLALNISKERGIDFLIPLKLDNTPVTEIGWMISDLTYIPFNRNLSEGIDMLLCKLDSIGAPKTLTGGRKIAIKSYIPTDCLIKKKETVSLNCLEIKQIPRNILVFRSTPGIEGRDRSKVNSMWPCYTKSSKECFSFFWPSQDLFKTRQFELIDTIDWKKRENIAGIPTNNVIINLLKRSLRWKCIKLGLEPTSDNSKLYFPLEYSGGSKIKFRSYTGRIIPVTTASIRNYPRKYKYHVAPEFSVRDDITGDFVIQLRIGFYITDVNGDEFSTRTTNSLRKNISRSWGNHQWFIKYLAIVAFLTDGGDVIKVDADDNQQLIISSKLMTINVPYGLDDSAIADLKSTASGTPKESDVT